jgi:hypothetical protein
MSKPNSRTVKGYKSAGKYMIKLIIDVTASKNNLTRDAKDPDYAMYRCSYAYVADIYDKFTNKHVDRAFSDFDKTFVYIKGTNVYSVKYDERPDEIFTHGIHFYLSEDPARYRNILSKDYTGIYKEWFDDGRPSLEAIYLNGKRQHSKYISYGDQYTGEILMPEHLKRMMVTWMH